MKSSSESAVCFGRVLKLARTRSFDNEMRQAELAKRLNISASAVSQAESGDRPPREQKLADWAAALEVPADQLQELYLLVQGLVPWDGDVYWYRDLWDEEGRPAGGPHRFLAVEMQKRLAPVLEAAGGAEVSAPRWYEAEYDPETDDGYPAYLGIPIVWSGGFSDDGPRGFSSTQIEVPEPLRQPRARREPRPEARPGDRLAAALSELNRREKDLVLAYIQGLVDARAEDGE